MKLICFSHNTGGGLLCNLFNNYLVFDEEDPIDYPITPYRVTSWQHREFKLGDDPTVQRIVDIDKWNQKIDKWKDSNNWFSTHAHPSVIPNLSIFDEVIAITTITRDSKLYRWLRHYYGWFKYVEPNWIENNDINNIDKIRCLAYNVFEPFSPYLGCKNIEFEDIVSGKFIQDNNLDLDYFNSWKARNPWLYPIDENSWAVKRFNEAEYELLNKVPYKYI